MNDDIPHAEQRRFELARPTERGNQIYHLIVVACPLLEDGPHFRQVRRGFGLFCRRLVWLSEYCGSASNVRELGLCHGLFLCVWPEEPKYAASEGVWRVK